MRSAVRAAAGAVTFLTRIPVEGRVRAGPEDVARGAALFPLVGAGIGALVAATALGLDDRLGLLLAVVLAVALETALTGAIHLDGLADTADGLGVPPAGALDVMREPALGAFGVTAAALALLAKTAALAEVVSGSDPLLAVVVAYALGRATPGALALAFPYARSEGPGGVLSAPGARRWLVTGLALALLLALALGPRGLALALGAAAGACLAALAARRLGGITGDVLGAAAELATIGALVAAAATR